MKCANCSNEASYTNADPGVNPVNYCTNCLPHWLQERAQAGHFPLVMSVEEAPAEEAPAEEAPVEEAPAEEAPVEEAPVEDKPKKKAATKSTVVQE